MNLGELISKLLPITEQLISPGGVESKLSQERFRKRIGLVFVAAGAVLQFIILVINGNVDSIKKLPYYLINFKDFICHVLTRKWDLAANYEIVVDLSGIVVLFVGITVYLFFSLRSAYKQYSEEPFKYTFWVEPFRHVQDTEKEKIKIEPQDRFHHLLHHDLMERLNDRIRRLFLLNPEKLDDSAKKNLSSHIHIEGHYTLREKKDGEWVIHMMPCVRIGSSTNPSTLSAPVKFKIEDNEIYGIESKLVNISSNKYKQIVERVYSSVATEIYKQIECDLKEKIRLFPTKYLRAVALYNEAEDFARSNTVDAYDRAIDLYKEAIQYFNITNIKPITNFFLEFPLLWRRKVKFVHMQSRIRIGYAKCLIYRREISALSGRYKNPLFGIRDDLNEVIDNLNTIHDRINKKWKILEKNEKNRLHTIMAFLTFPKDSWWRRILHRPNQLLFEKQNHLLFDAYLMSAYTYNLHGAVQKAKEYLDNAKAVDPQLSEKSALYHLVAGTIEPNVDKALLLFRQSAELASDFQMAKYLLAYYSEMKFRIQDEISEDRVKSVINEYEKVLDINPGNIAALAAQGYLYWLSGDLKKAKKKFEDGCEVKAISQQTFIGQLNYSLARIAAEEGEFNESYDKYNEAISSDPGVGAYSVTAGRYSITPFYDYIGFNMLKRYKKLKEKVETKIKDKKQIKERRVFSFVLNEYGNACLNYYHDTNMKEYLIKGIKAFEQSIELCPENRIVYYNLSNAYEWNFETEKSIECLKKAAKLEWHVTSIALAQAILRQSKEHKKRIEDEKKNKEKELNEKELKRSKKPAFTQQSSKASPGPTGVPAQQPTIRTISDKESEELEVKIKGLKEEIEKLAQREEKLTYDYIEIGNVVNSIIGKTKISPIYTGYEFNSDGQGVDKFFSKKDEIKKDKFDESDIEALRVWAELLSHNDKNPMAQNKAEDILEYILKEYYPENFDVLLPLHDMNTHILKDKIEKWLENKEKKNWIERIQEYRKKTVEYRKIIKPIIDNWDKQGLRRYVTSRWRESFFEEDLFISVILDVLKEKEDIKNPSELFDSKIERLSVLINECCGTTGFLETQEDQCNKEQAKFFNGIGNLFFNIFKVSESTAYYKKAVEFDTGVAVYHANLGGAYKGLKQWKEAEQSYLEAIKLEPKNAGYHNTLANLYWEIANWEKAINEYTKAFKLDNQPIYLCNLGRAYVNSEEKDKWDKMIKHCQKAVELRRDTPTDAFGLDYYYEFLAEGYFKDNRLPEFEKLFEELDDFKDEPEKKARIYNRIGNLFYDAFKDMEAITYYKKAVELDTRVAVYYTNLGGAYKGLKQWKEAEQSYLKAVALELNNAGHHNTLGNLYWEILNWEKAINEYNKAFELDNQPIYLCNLGRTYGNLGQWDKMIEHCQRAVELRRKTPTDAYGLDNYYEFLVEAYFKAGKLKEFEELFEKSGDLENEPIKKAIIYNKIGNLFAWSNRYQESIPYYEKATASDKKMPIYECNLGLTYGKLINPNWDKMIEHCSKAVELRRSTPTDLYGLEYYYEFLVEGYFKAGKLAEFEKLFEESGDLKDEPEKKARVYNKIANLFFETIKYQEAIPYYENAISLADNIAVYHGNLGLAFRALMQWDDAEAAFKRAASLEPNNAIYQNDLGNVYFERGNYEKAIPCYEKAIKLDPINQVYRENLEKCKKV